MNYELAKQLKEAGFLLKEVSYASGSGFTINGVMPIYAYPTLSELIEACGYHFHSLHVDEEMNGDTVWFATLKYDSRKFIPNENYRKGKTPEEAVAKLWLALKGSVSDSESDRN